MSSTSRIAYALDLTEQVYSGCDTLSAMAA
jgi:hypothetical protein